MIRRGAALALGFVLATSFVSTLAADDSAELDRLESRDMNVVLHFQRSPVTRILDALAGAGSFKVTFDGPVEDPRVSLDVNNGTIKQALLRLAQEGHLRDSVPGPKELVVRSGGEKPSK